MLLTRISKIRVNFITRQFRVVKMPRYIPIIRYLSLPFSRTNLFIGSLV